MANPGAAEKKASPFITGSEAIGPKAAPEAQKNVQPNSKLDISVGDWARNDFSGRLEIRCTVVEKISRPEDANRQQRGAKA